jgi:hypothetical protein
MTNRTLIIKPGPKRLAAALSLAGFSATHILPAVTDACGKHWRPSELQVALALCGGESSGSATAYHANADGSVDFGVLEINNRAHAGYFTEPQVQPEGWLWTDYLDNADAAYEIYVSAGKTFRPWKAYTGGGYLAERYEDRSWMDWAAFGVSAMAAAVNQYVVVQGKTQAAALALVASINDDPLTYWAQAAT